MSNSTTNRAETKPLLEMSGQPEVISPAYLRTVACNTEVSLQIITPTQAIRVRSHLVGVDRQLCLILHRGDDAAWLSAKTYIREGQAVVVRLINANESDARVIAFRSRIIKLISVVSNWLVLSFPQQLQALKLRKYSRLTLKIKAQLLNEQDQAVLSDGELVDISLSGCGYIGKTHSALLQTANLMIRIQLPLDELNAALSASDEQEPASVVLPVTLKNSNKKGDAIQGEVGKLGLAFTATPQECINAVQKILMRTLAG